MERNGRKDKKKWGRVQKYQEVRKRKRARKRVQLKNEVRETEKKQNEEKEKWVQTNKEECKRYRGGESCPWLSSGFSVQMAFTVSSLQGCLSFSRLLYTSGAKKRDQHNQSDREDISYAPMKCDTKKIRCIVEAFRATSIGLFTNTAPPTLIHLYVFIREGTTGRENL